MAFPDVLAAMVAWAKADPALAALHGGRVASRLPDPDTREYPFLRVFDVAASPPADAEYAVAQTLLQWDAFAGRVFDDRTAPDFAVASDLAGVLADRLRQFQGVASEPGWDPDARRIEWTPGSVVIIRGVNRAFGPGRQPDPEGLARYRVDTIVQAVAG